MQIVSSCEIHHHIPIVFPWFFPCFFNSGFQADIAHKAVGSAGATYGFLSSSQKSSGIKRTNRKITLIFCEANSLVLIEHYLYNIYIYIYVFIYIYICIYFLCGIYIAIIWVYAYIYIWAGTPTHPPHPARWFPPLWQGRGGFLSSQAMVYVVFIVHIMHMYR